MTRRAKASRVSALVDARVSEATRLRHADELERLKAPATPAEMDSLRGLLIAQGLLPMPNVRLPGGEAIGGDRYGQPIPPPPPPKESK